MKNLTIILIALIFAFSCKKKEVNQTQPESQVKECKSYPAAFTGKYYIAYDPNHHDTIEFTFLSSRCPSDPQQNNYNILNLGEAVQFNIKPGNVFDENRVYSVIIDEKLKTGTIGMGSGTTFYLYDHDSVMDVNSPIFNNIIHFKRFK